MIALMTNGQSTDSAPAQQSMASAPATKTTSVPKSWGCAFVLVLITLLAYQPAWHAGFIWDDDHHLTANPAMTAPHGLRMIWSSLAVSRYYPLTLTSFWVQRQLWGLNPIPYHLVNIALHAINGVLIFFLLRRLRVPGAWLAATLWALHPVNVESVAWITELKNTQSGALCFCALLCFLRFEAQGRRRWYALALLCGAGALLSKPSTVVLPLVLLWCAWWERGCWRRTDVVRTAPFFGLALLMSALTIVEQQGHILREGTAEWSMGIDGRLVLAGKTIWFYAVKLLWPVNLTFVYPRWEVATNSFGSWLPLAAVVAGGIVLYARRRKHWARAGAFGLGCFVAGLLPVLGFFDVYYFRYSYVADHFVYLACVGLISLAVGMGTAICNHAGQRGRNLGTVAAAIALLILGVSTWRQARVYKNLETLWSDTLTKNPQSLIAQNNLAWLLATLEPTEGGDPVRAVTLAERACKLTDHRVAACLDTLAVAYAAAGRFQDAVATAGKAIDLARSAGQTQLVSEFQSRLQLYRNGKAYRQAVDVTDPSKP
jgi:hypothetical protein